jgi:hypothetical protein
MYGVQPSHWMPAPRAAPARRRGLQPGDAQGHAADSELVASFANRSNLLKSQEKTDPCEIRTSGVHGPKNTAITRISTPALPQSCTHFSDHTALVCRGCPTPGPMRPVAALRQTRNQFLVSMSFAGKE